MSELPNPGRTPQTSKAVARRKYSHVWWWVVGGGVAAAVLFVAGVVLVAVIIGVRAQQSSPLDIAKIDPELDSTLRAMRITAKTGDWNGFCQYVDVPAVCGSIQAMSRAEISANNQAGKITDGEALWQSVVSGLLLHGLVTEQSCPLIMQFASTALMPDSQTPDPNIVIQEYFEGNDVFVRGGRDKRNGTEGFMIFRRDRINGWKLTGLSSRKP